MRMGRWAVFVAGALWVAAVGSGMGVLLKYASTSGRRADAFQTWPAGSRLQRTSGQPTLIVLAHPQCVCTRASLSELNVIMQRFKGKLTAYVLFMRPDDVPDDWE